MREGQGGQGRGENGARTEGENGFGEKDGGGTAALLLFHKIPPLSSPTQCLLSLTSDNVLHY